ncbi:MAG: agmatine deiminase family protein, partial [Myxococcota bacterium]|nr:agmatine deiminase family protein [Myxococcota bacterium]
MFGRRHIGLVISALLALGACSDKGDDAVALSQGSAKGSATTTITTAPPAAPGLAPRPRRLGDIEYIRYPDEPMKPANRSLTAFAPGKADAAGNVRYFAPERYAITEPPPAGIRAMVEWEPMSAVLMAVPTYMTTDSYTNSRGTIVGIAKHSATVAEVWFIMENQLGIDNLTEAMLDAGMTQAAIDGKVKFLIEQNDTVWTIDFGPLPIIDDATNSYAFADFRYYHERAIDDGLSTFLGRNLVNIDQASNIETYRMPLNTEGGTFQATEDGVCFTGDGQLFWMSYDTGSPDYTIMDLSLEELQTHPH